MNAIISAGKAKASGGTLYTTSSPCRSCMNAIINAEIARVVYMERYADPTHGADKGAWAVEAAERVGIGMDHITLPTTVAHGAFLAK
jgi:deoxycytidylate deaminase